MSRRRIPNLDKRRKPYEGRRGSTRRSSVDTVREVAAWVVERTLESRGPSTVYLSRALDRCDRHDHGLLRELALGTLRWLRRLDGVIEQASHRPLRKIEPALRVPLRVAVYQLLFLDRLPVHAIVNEAVEQARLQTHRGGASFVNAVLRRIAKQRSLESWPVEEPDDLRRLAIEKSHPDLLVERWVKRYGLEQTRELLDANNRPKPMQLLAFRDRGGRELLAERLIDEGFGVEPSRWSPVGLIVSEGNPLFSKCFEEGLFYIQDEASQAAALIPPPRAGERVLDMAAAPGGKGFTLAAYEPSIRLVMADLSVPRLGTVRSNLKRLQREYPLLAGDARRPPFGDEAFDRIVLDLPCSGTGTLRKNPELKWRIDDEEIGRLSRQALRLLEGCADRVVPGGRLVVITCSLEPEENDEVVEAFLRQRSDFTRGLLEGQLEYPSDRRVDSVGKWQLLPDDHHDGFTVHVLERRA